MEHDLKAGEVVRLKSGGPKMTIQDVGNYSTMGLAAKCVWFEASKRHEDVFALAMLERPEVPGRSDMPLMRG